MGTRGAYGFYCNGETKAVYNQFDSYPAGLGVKVVNDLYMRLRYCTRYENAADKMREYLQHVFSGLVLVDEEHPCKLDEELYRGAKSCWRLTDPPDGTTWYEWLRPFQGSIAPYFYGSPFVKLPMPNGSNFLYDSLFCEWAYIVNVDELVLEVHKGFNKDPAAEGRYVDPSKVRPVHGEDEPYYGVRLLETIPLLSIARDPVKVIERMEELDNGE